MKLILVDDDVRFLNSMQATLEKDYEVYACQSLDQLTRASKEIAADLLICDYDFGSENLEKFLKTSLPNVPVLVLTGKANRDNVVSLLNLGVSGFLDKPVELKDLREQIKRLTKDRGNAVIAVAKQLQIDFDPHFRKIYSDGSTIDLTPIEYKILMYFLSNPDQPILKKDLQNYLWPNVIVATNNIDTHLSNLKKKAPSLKKHLTTIYGGEYILRME